MEENDLDMPPEKLVFTAKEEDIHASARTQCKMEDHKWTKLSENEVLCLKCATALIVKNIKDYGC